MILLDTNVVSEPMKLRCDPVASAWLDRQTAGTLYIATTSLGELLAGIELLPNGKRKQALASTLQEFKTALLQERILAFDEAAALAYGPLVRRARISGFQISIADGQIAAIAEVHGFTVATRDVAPFLAAGVKVINPWVAQSS